jgi:hypothetical protein
MGDTIETILERQEEAARQVERNRRLQELYAEAQRHMKAQEWQQALERLEEVQRIEPTYRETQALLAQAHQQDSAEHIEKEEASNRQRQQTVGQSTDQAERAQPDYSTDAQLHAQLPILGRNWWALALAGLVNAGHGLGDWLVLPRLAR